jgi:hypothetical protein
LVATGLRKVSRGIQSLHEAARSFGTPPSSSLQSLKEVVASLNIEEDPWVIDKRAELGQLESGPRRNRVDQKLSSAIHKQSTFTHKGLRDFECAADEICTDLGEWAADWYIQQVFKQAAAQAAPFPSFPSIGAKARGSTYSNTSHALQSPLSQTTPKTLP